MLVFRNCKQLSVLLPCLFVRVFIWSSFLGGFCEILYYVVVVGAGVRVKVFPNADENIWL